MKDEFEATFVVEVAPDAVFEALAKRTLDGDDGGAHPVLPGFPSLTPLPLEGASFTPLELEPGKLLRLRKDHHPCQGTEVAVRLERAGTGTRVTVVQSGFGAFLDMMGPDTVFGHGHQIVNDLRLYLERGLTVPGTAWGANLGARTKHAGVGVEVFAVDSGFAKEAGLEPGDLLLTLRGIRIHDLPQLWTVLALTEPGSHAELTWARGRERMSATAKF